MPWLTVFGHGFIVPTIVLLHAAVEVRAVQGEVRPTGRLGPHGSARNSLCGRFDETDTSIDRRAWRIPSQTTPRTRPDSLASTSAACPPLVQVSPCVIRKSAGVTLSTNVTSPPTMASAILASSAKTSATSPEGSADAPSRSNGASDSGDCADTALATHSTAIHRKITRLNMLHPRNSARAADDDSFICRFMYRSMILGLDRISAHEPFGARGTSIDRRTRRTRARTIRKTMPDRYRHWRARWRSSAHM